MSSLYEINQELLNCIDMDSGEIIDIEKFDSLQIEKTDKLENVGLWYKNLLSEANQYKIEKDNFADRQKRAEKTAESLKNYLVTSLQGNKFKTTKIDISYRKSATLEYDGTTLLENMYWKQNDPTLDKALLKKVISDGAEIAGCQIVEHNNIQIK